MTKSIDQTNALNTPVKQYKQMAKTPPPKGDRTSAPNYRNLSRTPNQAAKERISERMQFGQPPKDQPHVPKDAVPQRVSNRLALSRAKGTKEPIIAKKPPLKEPAPQKRIPTKGQPVSSRPLEQPFRNRFDHPLTERELNQLRLTRLKGTDQKHTHELLQKLSGQSKQLAQQLSVLLIPAQPIKQEPVPIKSEPMVPVKKEPIRDLTNQLLDAQEDARYLEEDYPKLKQQEQQAALNLLRDKYKAPKTSNPKHIQKIIRDRLTQIRDEIQSL